MAGVYRARRPRLASIFCSLSRCSFSWVSIFCALVSWSRKASGGVDCSVLLQRLAYRRSALVSASLPRSSATSVAFCRATSSWRAWTGCSPCSLYAGAAGGVAVGGGRGQLRLHGGLLGRRSAPAARPVRSRHSVLLRESCSDAISTVQLPEFAGAHAPRYWACSARPRPAPPSHSAPVSPSAAARWPGWPHPRGRSRLTIAAHLVQVALGFGQIGRAARRRCTARSYGGQHLSCSWQTARRRWAA